MGVPIVRQLRSLDFTTAARVRPLLTSADIGATSDPILSRLITSVSARMTLAMNRHTKSAAGVEQYQINASRLLISLRGCPVVAVASVKSGNKPDLSVATPLLDGTDYFVDYARAELRFLTRPDAYVTGPTARQVFPSFVEIEYTGGIVDTTDNMVALYPDLSDACAIQVAALQKRSTRGMLDAVSSDTGGGSTMNFDAPYKLLDEVADVCELYRRRGSL